MKKKTKKRDLGVKRIFFKNVYSTSNDDRIKRLYQQGTCERVGELTGCKGNCTEDLLKGALKAMCAKRGSL
jgi:hypothetical protein